MNGRTHGARRGARALSVLAMSLASGCLPYRAPPGVDSGPVLRDAAVVADASTDAAREDFTAPVTLDDDALREIDPSTLLAASAPCRPPMLVRVDWVADGDTISVESLDGASSERVRIMAVDTPEIAHAVDEVDECYGPEASMFTQQLVGHLVWLTFDETCLDTYGRTLAYVHVSAAPEGSWSRQLVRRGFARVLVVGRNRLMEAVLTDDAASARAEALGFWSACPL